MKKIGVCAQFFAGFASLMTLFFAALLAAGAGTFTMNVRVISGNTGFSGGAVYVNNGTFVVKGGSISGNTVKTATLGVNKADSRFGGGVAGGNLVIDAGSGAVVEGNAVYLKIGSP
jgi:hypothetical protein